MLTHTPQQVTGAAGPRRPARTLLAVAATGLAALAGCSTAPSTPATTYSQAALAEPVRVPGGHRVAMETVGTGTIVYECREKAGAAGTYEWTFVGPDAVLTDRAGRRIGRYYGPPATWEAADGSKLTGRQLAVSPGASGAIPLQLVVVEPAVATGSMGGITHIQRVATVGGVAPAMACDGASRGRRETVNYRADYIFWKAM